MQSAELPELQAKLTVTAGKQSLQLSGGFVAAPVPELCCGLRPPESHRPPQTISGSALFIGSVSSYSCTPAAAVTVTAAVPRRILQLSERDNLLTI